MGIVTKIVNNVLVKVNNDDIKDGTFIIPDDVTSIGEYAFSGCNSLKSITIPEGVTSIGECAFNNCVSLKTITLPDGLTSIGESAFSDCKSLETIIIPEGVTSIGEGTFSGCYELKTITLPDGLTSIGESAFSDCEALKTIDIPKGVTIIGEHAFSDCKLLKTITIPKGVTGIGKGTFSGCEALETITISEGVTSIGECAFNNCVSLKTITLPDGLTSIGESAFVGCQSLNQLITPYGNIEIDKYGVIQSYLYLYANSILKDKYSNFNEFVGNDYIERLINADLICSNESIDKFKNLFYKLRKNYDIPYYLFQTLFLEQTEKIDYKTWKEIENLLDIVDIEMAEAVSEMIAIFGLFENDNGARGRLQDYIDFIRNKNIVLTNNMSDDTEPVNYTYYQLKSGIIIPEEFSIDLTNTLTENEMKNVKRLTGNYGKRINDFIKANYETVNAVGYKVEGNIEFYEKLHRMFDGCCKKFDIDFYNFFMKYIDTILKDEVYQRRVKDIQKNFQSIKAYYKLHAGTDEVTLKQAINYVENIEFYNVHEGNIEFAKDVKRAGVANQKAFEYYQKIFEANGKRKLTSLVKRNNIYDINGFRIKTELLRKDDSFELNPKSWTVY